MEQALKMFEVQFFFVQLESCPVVRTFSVSFFDFPRDLSTFQFGVFGVLGYLRLFLQILA